MAKKLYGKGILPSCSYCSKGKETADKVNILCPKKGIVNADFSCRRFKYDPLRRVPKIPPELEKFTAADFSIETEEKA
ncbi:MAG: hypothetical protein ACI39F_00125 [Acutalibacteraceae bacterium]